MAVTTVDTANQVIATTLEWYNKNGFGNSIKTINGLLACLMDGKLSPQGLRKLPGGRKITEQVILNTDANAQWYAGAETLNKTQSDAMREANFDWKQFAGNLVVSGIDYRNCTGKFEKQNLMRSIRAQVETTAKETIGQGMWATSQVANQILAIPTIVDDAGVIGGLDPVTYPKWASYVLDSAIVDTAVTADELLDAMEETYNNIAAASGKMPNLVVANAPLYTKYGRACQELKRFNPTRRHRADIGFEGYDFNSAFFVLDNYCPVNEIYFINTEDFTLNVHQDAYFKFTPLAMDNDSDSYFSRLLFQGELSVRQRNTHGKITFATAAS